MIKKLFGNFFKKKKKRVVIVLSLRKLKIAAALLVLLIAYGLIQAAGFDMYLDCEKKTYSCTISKKSAFDHDSIDISRFDTEQIYEVSVAPRKLENKKVIYDILLNFGVDKGEAFIDYGFTNPIKANTVLVKFAKYLETGAPELSVSKHCYFNEYFCF